MKMIIHIGSTVVVVVVMAAMIVVGVRNQRTIAGKQRPLEKPMFHQAAVVPVRQAQ